LVAVDLDDLSLNDEKDMQNVLLLNPLFSLEHIKPPHHHWFRHWRRKLGHRFSTRGENELSAGL
jgi:hypothetical protein